MVAAVGLEPDGKGVAEDGDGSDGGVEEDIHRHGGESHAGDTAPAAFPNDGHADEGCDGIAESGKKSENGIEAEADVGAGDAEAIVHHGGDFAGGGSCFQFVIGVARHGRKERRDNVSARQDQMNAECRVPSEK